MRDALNILGFQVEHFKDSDSEFDAIFQSDEGRFLGEVEGKDNKAIDIEKFSQIARNLEEDFSRPGVDEYAIGVLLGNAYRFTRPKDRKNFFTQKCQKGAMRSNIALIRTTDLYDVVKWLKQYPDNSYARSCRQAIRDGCGGVVRFPKPGKSKPSARKRSPNNSEK